MKREKVTAGAWRLAPCYVVLSLPVIYLFLFISNDEILEDRIIESRISLSARLFPENYQAVMNQAWFLFNNTRYAEQVAVLEKYHKRHPETSSSVKLLGDGYAALDDYQKAALCYEAAIQKTKRENKTVSPYLRERLERCRQKL